MANSDYTARAGGYGFCPMGYLTTDITPLQTAVVMTGFTSPIDDGVRIGMAAMIDDEIVVVTARSGNNVSLGRGCCDTVPAIHSSATPIWFFDDSIGRDDVEYAGTETIGVKVLPRTPSGGSVPIANSPPAELTFGLRFARPYPPGLVLANGSPWYTVQTINDSTPDLVLTWAHRNRVTQQDQLVTHPEASISPEVGATYTLKVYNGSNALVRTFSDVITTTTTYTLTQALVDFDEAFSSHTGHIDLYAVRDGLESYQKYRIDFLLELPDQPYGLGYRLGEYLGTDAP